VRRYQARLDAARHKTEGVEEGLGAAVAIYREAERLFDQATTQLELAEWLVAEGRAPAAAGLLNESQAIFERLKARPWLDRVAKVRAAVPASS